MALPLFIIYMMNSKREANTTKQLFSREFHQIQAEDHSNERINSINSSFVMPLDELNYSSQFCMNRNFKNQSIPEEEFYGASSNSLSNIIIPKSQVQSFYSGRVLKVKKINKSINKNFPRIIVNIIQLHLDRFTENMQQQNFFTFKRKVKEMFKTKKPRCTSLGNLVSLLEVSSYRNQNRDLFSIEVRRNLSRIIRECSRTNRVNSKNEISQYETKVRLKIYALRCRNKWLITRCQV